MELGEDVVSPHIFRAYDIRGVVDEALSENAVRLIGQAIGTVALSKNQDYIIVGRDGRLSGERLLLALTQGLLSTGIHVVDIGMVPTPLVYFSTHVLPLCGVNTSSGVMLTGSHNPANYNGLKIMIAGETLSGEGILNLYACIRAREFKVGEGQYQIKNMAARYTQEILSDIKFAKPLKVVIDCGNGIAGNFAPSLLSALNCSVIPLYCEIDGRFPNHHPDPSQPENLQDLIQAVKQHKADIGLAFDGDGDRLGVVTNQGEIIWPDRILMLYAEAILAKNPGAEIVYDVKCSKHLTDVILAAGGLPCMNQTGHSFMKAKMKASGALLGGEMSGHFFFQDRWYGFDDAIYAACRLLEILSSDDVLDASGLFARLPNSVNTPEMNIAISDEKKFDFVRQLKKYFDLIPDSELITIDGLRVELKTGWGLVRASNTTPNLVLRFEAQTQAELSRLQDLFKQVMQKIEPDLLFPF
jgi:phosphomannomutase/phosphoglucomutase